MNQWRIKRKIQDSLDELCTQLRDYYLVGELKELSGVNYQQALEECKEYMKDGRLTLYAALYDLKGNQFEVIRAFPFQIKKDLVVLDVRNELGNSYISKSGKRIIVEEQNLVLVFTINREYVKYVLEPKRKKAALSQAN